MYALCVTVVGALVNTLQKFIEIQHKPAWATQTSQSSRVSESVTFRLQ